MTANDVPIRAITEVQTLRALTHPVRIALMEALVMHGPLTATEAGEWIGETSTTCSFHLRQLAKYGIVEEAGGGRGRARPWRMISTGFQIEGAPDDPETALASSALSRLLRERQLGRYQEWIEGRSAFPAAWRNAAMETQLLFFLTVEEMEALKQELIALLGPRALERLNDPGKRPPGSVPVEMLVFGYPVEVPEREA
jgi:predicted ArsR family transcriptional regulator